MTTLALPVAAGIVERHLGLLGCLDAGRAVEREIGWAGPVALPLEDELDVQAACGVMHVHGRSAGQPLPIAVDYVSAVAGVLATQGVLATLIARARGLALRSVRTSASQGALLAISQYLASATAGDDFREPLGVGDATFTAADGVRFEIETLDADEWQRFWRRIGAEQTAVSRGWRPFVQRFATATCCLPAELHNVLASLPIAAIRAAAGRVSIVPVSADPTAPDEPPWRFRPLPGTAQVPRAPASLPLDGLVVVEATRRVQGPLAGHVLRMLGAEVIRIEPPGGDPLRGAPPMAGACSARFLALNAGKRVVEIDITTTAGRSAVHELVRDADVFLHNWAPGKAAQLGLDSDRLAVPGLVYAWAGGWGNAPGTGSLLGTDFLVQAHSGVAAAVRSPGEPAAPSLMTLTDVLGGLVCAEGVLAALLTRVRSGRGSRVDTSLLSAAGVIPRARRALAEPSTPVCDDLGELAADVRFARALDYDGYAFPRTPWEFA